MFPSCQLTGIRLKVIKLSDSGHAISQSHHAQGQQDGHPHHEHGQPEGHAQNELDHQSHTHSGILNALGDCQVVIDNGMGQRLCNDLNENNYKVLITRETDISYTVSLFQEGSTDSDGWECCSH